MGKKVRWRKETRKESFERGDKCIVEVTMIRVSRGLRLWREKKAIKRSK